MTEILHRIANANSIRFIAVFGYIAYICVSVYLCVTGKVFTYYGEFAAMTAGTGTITALGGRLINSALNSPKGEMPVDKN